MKNRYTNIIMIFVLFIAMGMSKTLLAQERTISGVVTLAEDGTTLPGATVVVKGTTIGTITDLDGFFYLENVCVVNMLI